MHALLMRVAARTLFSTGVDGATIDEARRCLRIVSQGIYKRTVAPLGIMEKLPTPGNRRYDRANARLRQIVDEMISDRRAVRRRPRRSALHAAARRTPGDGAGLNDREVLDQVVTFLVAGSETTASTLAFVFHLLGTHPEIEKADARRDRRGPRRPDTHLRGSAEPGVHPRGHHRVAAAVSAVLDVDAATAAKTELAGRTIRPGTVILYSAQALHHNPELFPVPERFDPERWLADRAKEVPRGALHPVRRGQPQVHRGCSGAHRDRPHRGHDREPLAASSGAGHDLAARAEGDARTRPAAHGVRAALTAPVPAGPRRAGPPRTSVPHRRER